MRGEEGSYTVSVRGPIRYSNQNIRMKEKSRFHDRDLRGRIIAKRVSTRAQINKIVEKN